MPQEKDKKNKGKDGMNWLRELMQLQPYGIPKEKTVRTVMNIWAPLALVFSGFISFVWFKFGLIAFSLGFAIALAIVLPAFILVMDILNFVKNEKRTSSWVNYGRIGISFVLTLFTSLAWQLDFFHGDITDLQRATIVTVAHDKINAVWNPQIKSAEDNVVTVNKQIDTDRTNMAEAQKKEMDQALELEKAAVDAVRRKTERTSIALDAASKVKILRKDAGAQHDAIGTLRTKQKEETDAFDAKIIGKRKGPQDTVTTLRVKKAQEEKNLQTLSNAEVESKYGVVIKTGMIDQIGTLYSELPKTKGSSVWWGLLGCFALVFILELGPFFARNLATRDLAEYYMKDLQDAIKAARVAALDEIGIKATPAMEAISTWRKAVDTDLEQGVESLDDLNAMLRKLWNTHVDGPVTAMYIAAAKKGDEGVELLDEFLAKNGHGDLHYEKKPWLCKDAAQAKELWNWEPRQRNSNVSHLPARRPT